MISAIKNNQVGDHFILLLNVHPSQRIIEDDFNGNINKYCDKNPLRYIIHIYCESKEILWIDFLRYAWNWIFFPIKISLD